MPLNAVCRVVTGDGDQRREEAHQALEVPVHGADAGIYTAEGLRRHAQRGRLIAQKCAHDLADPAPLHLHDRRVGAEDGEPDEGERQDVLSYRCLYTMQFAQIGPRLLALEHQSSPSSLRKAWRNLPL